jgi:hypothetical protein
VFTASLWVIIYSRSESLIRLQFEQNVTHQNGFANLIPSYKALIRSIGTAHDVNTSVEILNDIYQRVQDNCHEYYKSIGIKNFNLSPKESSQMKKELMNILCLCTLLILICIGVFMVVDALVMCSTRHVSIRSHFEIF